MGHKISDAKKWFRCCMALLLAVIDLETSSSSTPS